MHVLGHSFSQRRKPSKRPRDLHIRKISFSGSSLSSGCSLSSSTDSTVSTMTAPAALNPLHLHPAYQAPPRLHERAFITKAEPISHAHEMYEHGATFFDDDDEEDEDDDADILANFEMVTRELPPHTSPPDHGQDEVQEVVPDYFLLPFGKRPSLPRSRWSESTIQSVLDTSVDDIEDDMENEGADRRLSIASSASISTISSVATPTDDDSSADAAVSVVLGTATAGIIIPTEPIPIMCEQGSKTEPTLFRSHSQSEQSLATNFGYKRSTTTTATLTTPLLASDVPRRPPFKSLDSIDDLIKRGGWKRKGIIFHKEEVAAATALQSDHDAEDL